MTSKLSIHFRCGSCKQKHNSCFQPRWGITNF